MNYETSYHAYVTGSAKSPHVRVFIHSLKKAVNPDSSANF